MRLIHIFLYYTQILQYWQVKDVSIWLGTDSKAQVTMLYNSTPIIHRTYNVVCSSQHTEEFSWNAVRDGIKELVVKALEEASVCNWRTHRILDKFTGKFVIGGP